jgi:hypothetical protein
MADDLLKLLDTVERARRAARRAYDFAPSAYTWAALAACHDAFMAIGSSLATDDKVATPASGDTEATQPERQTATPAPATEGPRAAAKRGNEDDHDT